MLVFRYLAKEVFITFIALTAILMFIISTNQLALYMNRAASGSVPGLLVFKLMCLELPNLMMVLFPFGFFLSVILAFGRIYSENEMVVLHSGGLSTRRLFVYTLLMSSVVGGLVTSLVAINPGIAAERARLLQNSGMKAFIQLISPQKFQALSNNQILFVEEMNRKHTKAQGLFMAKRNLDSTANWQWQVVIAKELHLESMKSSADHLVMNSGGIYNLSPGKSKAQIGSFESATVKIPETIFNTSNDLRSIPLKTLWQEKNISTQLNAEFQWRLSLICMVFVLTFVAVPLSPVNPRSGRFAKILPAIIIFLIYIAALFHWREQVADGRAVLGNMLTVHGIIIFMASILFWRQKRVLA